MSTLDRQIAALKQHAHDHSNLSDYMFYDTIERERTQLRFVGQLAARIYHDHSDEAAWDALYEALSVAGLLERPRMREKRSRADGRDLLLRRDRTRRQYHGRSYRGRLHGRAGAGLDDRGSAQRRQARPWRIYAGGKVVYDLAAILSAHTLNPEP